ncbi:MAG: YbaB/EbfC family nucleoid-associated protein, partial [Sphingobacterium sp.]
VSGEAEGGKVKVIVTANKEVREISVDPEFYAQADKEELEEIIIVAVNKALAQAENVSQSEMQAVSQDLLGGFGNLFNK